MKKCIISAIMAMTLASCSSYTYVPPTPIVPTSKSRLRTTATYRGMSVGVPVTPPLIADLKVSSEKISFPLLPSDALLKTDVDNIINTAVREALKVHDNSDVLIGMEYQIKYGDMGVIESVTVTGYPAKYVNFRHPSESIWLNENTFIREVNTDSK